MNPNKTAKSDLILCAVFVLPVAWAALLAAPCLGGSLAEFMDRLTTALAQPFRIEWCDQSPRCLTLFLAAYAVGILVYYSSRPKLRVGMEHGSAVWGEPKQINAVLCQDDNIILTKRVRLGLDTHKHRRNLNILVLGGSGAGKTRYLALPNAMECNTSYVITDPNGLF